MKSAGCRLVLLPRGGRSWLSNTSRGTEPRVTGGGGGTEVCRSFPLADIDCLTGGRTDAERGLRVVVEMVGGCVLDARCGRGWEFTEIGSDVFGDGAREDWREGGAKGAKLDAGREEGPGSLLCVGSGIMVSFLPPARPVVCNRKSERVYICRGSEANRLLRAFWRVCWRRQGLVLCVDFPLRRHRGRGRG